VCFLNRGAGEGGQDGLLGRDENVKSEIKRSGARAANALSCLRTQKRNLLRVWELSIGRRGMTFFGRVFFLCFVQQMVGGSRKLVQTGDLIGGQ